MTSSAAITADHYRLLGVSREASPEEIRSAYRAKLRRCHPDLVADESEGVLRASTEMTARLNDAYRDLSDPGRRAAYDARSAGHPRSSRPASTSPPRRDQRKSRSGRRAGDMIAISLGGIVLPLLVLAWASGLLADSPPANTPLIATLSTGAMAATIWLLTSSRLLGRRDRLARIGVAWSHLTRWSGWILIGGGVVLLGIPAIGLILMALVGAPFFGLVLVAFISSRFDSDDR